jgi:hypothetical protein
VIVRTIGVAALLTCLGASAAAFEGDCLIEVDGRSCLDGSCNIEMRKDGSFTVGVAETRSDYFAYVTLGPEPGIAEGYWNGPEGGGYAHDALGTLRREGACWANGTARRGCGPGAPEPGRHDASVSF